MTLQRWFAMTGTAPKWVAEACGVRVQTVYRWRDGNRTPRGRHLAQIMAFTSGAVTPLDFLPAIEVAP